MLTPGCYSIPQGIHKQSSMHIEDKEKITEDKQKKNTRPLTKLASIFRSKSTEDLASPDNLRQGYSSSQIRVLQLELCHLREVVTRFGFKIVIVTANTL